MKGTEPLARMLRVAFGELSWAPPEWLTRIGARRAGWWVAGVVVAATLVAGGYLYYQSLPKPLRVLVDVAAPGITPIVDGELRPESLRLDFHYAEDKEDAEDTEDAETADRPVLAAARLDLVGETVEWGIDLSPETPGEWRFTTENRLVFKPEEDWPAGRRYTVLLSRELFAPGVELASRVVDFETPGFVASIKTAEFYQHPVNAAERRVVASFGFSHPASRESFEERVGLRMQGGDRRVVDARIEYGPHDRTAHVLSEILAVPERERFVTVAVRADVEPAIGEGAFEEELSVQVRLPDRETYFRVDGMRASIVDDAEGNPVQTAVVTFTDQVDTDEFASRTRGWVLPRDHVIGNTTYQYYRWRSPREVTAGVLADSEPLELTVNPTERDAAKLQSVTFDAPAGRYVYLRVEAGLTSEGDFVMASFHDDLVEAPDYPKEATIAQDGALLPLMGNRLLTLSARGVEAVKVDIQQLLPGTLNHLASQTSGDIRDPWFRGYGFDTDNLAKLTTRIVDLNPGHPREQVFATVDLAPYLDAGSLFYVTVQGWDPVHERVVGTRDRRMALLTDLGLLVKTNADKSQHVFVHSIATGAPVSGAEVELLGRNGLPVLSSATDVRGHALLESASDFERDRAPTVFVVRKGQDVTFMPYQRSDRKLSWSGFDTGGEHVAADDAERLRAAVYTDRGLYRPGETVRMFGIVRRGDFGAVPGTPVRVTVSDARATTVLLRDMALPRDGLLTWNLETQPEWPTGRYDARVVLIDDQGRHRTLGEVSFSVEDYQPDRLRIRAAIVEGAIDGDQATPRGTGWLHPGRHHAEVNLQNLFGTPAQGRAVRGTVELHPLSPRFAEHPGFVFTDPFRDPDAPPKSVTVDLGETTTGDDGVAKLSFDVAQYDNGIYRLLLAVEGFESGGGRSVRARAGTLMSAAAELIGYRVDGDLDFIALDSERNVRFLAVDRNLAPAAVDDLEAVLVERRYVSALVKRPNGTYGYRTVDKEETLERVPFALSATSTDYMLPTTRPGRFALELNRRGVTVSRVEFAVAGTANIAGNLERDAELDLKLDRRSYAPGDEIELEIGAPYAGTGLITIERDRVHAFAWIRSDTNSTMARIRVPDDLEGNAYVNVAFVRDIESEEIFVNPLSYAVAPFAIDRAARRLDIELEAPERVRPGAPLTIGYSTPETARVVLFAVDEGILQVAKYNTPDPLERFLPKKALQVDTHQMVDLILPDYEVVRRAAAAPGGGELARLLGANLNPFRRRSEPPAVFWAGVVDAGPERRETVFDVPDYFNGELRVIAVGVGATKLGARDVPVTVRGPIVLTPNLPLAVAPEDVFEVSVGVANNVRGSGSDARITVTLEDVDGFAVEGESTLTRVVAEGGESRVTFRVRARTSPGEANLALTARLGDTAVARTTSVSIRPAVPFETTVLSGFAADGQIDVGVPRRIHEAFADRRVAASASPLVLADGLLAYLDSFPHGCAEQLVSKTFPQLGLLRSPSFGLRRAAYGTLFRSTVTRLRSRQHADGGFLFWATSAEAAPFPSVYIAHFLTDAVELGMAVPADMRSRASDYLRRIANATDRSAGRGNLIAGDLRAARTRAYAIYVLTRQGSVTTNYLDALQEALEDDFEDRWRTDLTAVYMAASHALLRNTVLAEGLIDGYRLGDELQPDTDFDTRLGRDAQFLYLLARHFPQRAERLDGDVVRRLVEPVFQNRFNTLSAAYTILALGELHRALEERRVLSPPAISAHGPAGAVELAVTDDVFARAPLPVEVERIDIDGTDAGVYFTTSESGFDLELPTGTLAQGLEIDRVYLDAAGDEVDRLRVGDELTVRLRIRSQGGRIGNVAVIDLLPGGFEIITESVRNRYGRWRSTYRDVREDRLVLYGAFDERMTEIRYVVKATSPGEFAAPAAHGAAMYHRGVRGRSAPGRLIVES